MRWMVAGLLTMVVSSSAAAEEDYPKTGFLYGSKESSSLEYHCQKLNNGNLQCEFVQMSVRHKAKRADIDKRVSEAGKSYESALAEVRKEGCDDVDNWLDVATGKMSIPEAAKLWSSESSNPDEVAAAIAKFRGEMTNAPDRLALGRALAAFCHDPTMERYVATIESAGTIDMKTCNISSNRFTQTFVSVDGTWVVQGAPEGQCGVVQLSRFEKAQDAFGMVIWNYMARKAATNPAGDLLPGLTCEAGVDQGEYPYIWKKSRDSNLGCQFIEFTPI